MEFGESRLASLGMRWPRQVLCGGQAPCIVLYSERVGEGSNSLQELCIEMQEYEVAGNMVRFKQHRTFGSAMRIQMKPHERLSCCHPRSHNLLYLAQVFRVALCRMMNCMVGLEAREVPLPNGSGIRKCNLHTRHFGPIEPRKYLLILLSALNLAFSGSRLHFAGCLA